jgi:hypothetical protein
VVVLGVATRRPVMGSRPTVALASARKSKEPRGDAGCVEAGARGLNALAVLKFGVDADWP